MHAPIIRGSTSVLGMLIGTVVLIASWADVGRTQEAAAGSGAALYVANGCWQCHGYEGQGGEAVRIAPSAYPYEAFLQFVRRPANVMPAYSSDALSDADLREIYAYVQSRPEPAPLEEFPLLN